MNGINAASHDNTSVLPFILAIVLIIAGFIFLYLYFKCKRFVIFAYTNCGKGILFTIQPESSFIFKPEGAVDFTNEDVVDIVNFIGQLVDRNKSSSVSIQAAPVQYAATPATAASPTQNTAATAAPAAAPATAQAAPATAQAAPVVESVSRYNSEDSLAQCMIKKNVPNENDLANCLEPLVDDPDFQDAISLARPERQAQLLKIQYRQAETFMKDLLKTFNLSSESGFITCSEKIQEDPSWLNALKSASPEREKELRTLLEKRGTDYYMKKVLDKYRITSEDALIKKSVILYFTSKIDIKKNENLQCALSCFPEARKTELLNKIDGVKRRTNNIFGLIALGILVLFTFLVFVVPRL